MSVSNQVHVKSKSLKDILQGMPSYVSKKVYVFLQ